MTSITAPVSWPDKARKARWPLVLPIALLLALGAALTAKAVWTTKAPALTGMFFTVTPTDLDVKITKDGELQAANNIDIISTVEGQATITQIVKEGSYV